jgi:hypothetical protein
VLPRLGAAASGEDDQVEPAPFDPVEPGAEPLFRSGTAILLASLRAIERTMTSNIGSA